MLLKFVTKCVFVLVLYTMESQSGSTEAWKTTLPPTPVGWKANNECLGVSRRGCNRLRKRGVACEFYTERSPLTRKAIGCAARGLCLYKRTHKRACRRDDSCMYLSKRDVPGRRSRYNCVPTTFCGFRRQVECEGFSHCSWDLQSETCVNKFENRPEPALTRAPSSSPTQQLAAHPTSSPSKAPTTVPTTAPTTSIPTSAPTESKYNSAFGAKPNLFFILLDDLGHGDAGFGPDPRSAAPSVTPVMTRLANEGLILTRHYAHWHCSPSRRSFLTGRLPIHTSEDLSNEYDDHMDKRWSWISEKLKEQGYYNVFAGKGHLGFRFWSSLPLNRGFDEHIGMLGGFADYRSRNRWKGLDNYRDDDSYSTMFIGKFMENKVREHFAEPDAAPMFAFIPHQAPHSPIQCPGGTQEERNRYDSRSWPRDCMFRMIWALDKELGYLENALKDVGQWERSVIVLTSDNGGSRRHFRQHGNNFPFRAEKSTSFEGSLRVPTFVTGGFLPDSMRGQTSDLVSHVSDWYTTFCHLAGADHTDASPVPPKHLNVVASDVKNVYKPAVDNENVWGELSYPDVDGVNLWPLLWEDVEVDLPADAAHEKLVVTSQVIIAGNYKLVTGQPCELSIFHEGECIDQIMYGWVDKRGRWNSNPASNVPAQNSAERCLSVIDHRVHGANGQVLAPCLFDLDADPRETFHITDRQDLLNALWTDLNNTLVYQYTNWIPGKENGLSPQGSCTDWQVDPSRINVDYRPVCE